MKRIWFAASAAIVLAAPAMAADLPIHTKAPVIEPPSGWSGFYAGLNAGYARRNSDPAVDYVGDPTTNALPAAMPSLRGSGFTGGAPAGYTWQRGRWGLGGAADFSWLGAGSAVRVQPFWVTDPFINYMDMSSRYDWLSTARLRAGVLVTPDLLLYATGGLAITQVVDSATHTYPTFPSTGTWSERRTLYGAALGGGLEYGFAPNWSVKAEYLHAFFNNVNPQWTTPDLVVGSPISFAHSLDLARVGVNYRWNAPQVGGASSAFASCAPTTWSGFYAGVHAGYGWGSSDPFSTANVQHNQPWDLATLPAASPKGALGGAQLGYNWQTGVFVFGGEVDVSAFNGGSQSTISPLYIGLGDTGTFSSRYDWLATARLRAGFTPVADLLLYATGGLAVTRVTDTAVDSNIPQFFNNPPTTTFNASSTLFGGAVGGGLEYAFVSRWSFKAEYLYAAFNKTAPRYDTVGWAPPFVGFDHTLNIVRAGINYQFGAVN
ncbi:MAG: outer membrane protein [Xanthobacteraceae bacterium]